MIQGRLIVCIANSWDYDPTSKHHVMKALARHNDILWINYRGTRRPEISRTDGRDVLRALRGVASGLRRIAPSMVELTPLVIPGAKSRFARYLHRRMLIHQIRRAVRVVLGSYKRPIQVWSFAPDVPYLVDTLGEECFLYYCVDEYRHFEGFDAERIARTEDELIDRADLVVTTSEPLLNSKRRHRPDTVLVRHGVDYDHFAKARQQTLPCPPELESIPGPRFGFFGLIQHWVDLALLARVAELRPDYSFVLLGEAKVDVSRLTGLSNVHLLGRKPYETLPAFCAHFDVGLMFFAQNRMTRSVNPIKMYEYLAAGLPVVSTPLPEAKRFESAIAIADTAESFAQACDRALATGGRDRDRIARLVQGETWLSRVESLSDIVTTRIGSIVRTASASIAPPTSVPCSRSQEADATLVACDKAPRS